MWKKFKMFFGRSAAFREEIIGLASSIFACVSGAYLLVITIIDFKDKLERRPW